MLYSVWNQGVGGYDYFEDGSKQATLNTPAPSHIPSRTLGSTVDQAAWPLPPSAKKVGSGAQAIGRVASRGGGASLGDIVDGSLAKAGLLAGCAFLLYKYVVKGRRR